ncbi:hypothetical protein H5410_002879 [Solanum commersonii]|uniref:Reverse transcriptase n=1 Tax=Solanum commersonii TaxID=4109 RepID=A0A9J6B3K6_SOLCO|nr:hypothetical protein H5410_002879 [Solanum commersonii]
MVGAFLCGKELVSPPINHISYANDIIHFCSRDRKSIGKMVNVVRKYEMVSRQMINLNKSFFYPHDKTPLIVGVRLRRMTGIRHGNFPFTYLGRPVYYGRKKRAYFEELVKKVKNRVLMWHNKWLSYGGNSY